MIESRLQHKLHYYTNKIQQMPHIQVEGQLTRLIGLTLEAVGCHAPIGSRCLVENAHGEKIEAEVVGFTQDKIFLMCIGDTQGLAPGAKIVLTGQTASVPVSDQVLGRVLDGSGQPLDNGPAIRPVAYYPLLGKLINPLDRMPISQPLDVGVRAINSLTTIGKGQRIGLFAGSGVGKSVLLSMMTRFTEADVVIVGLVGERGREVKEFIEYNLGKENMQKACVVAAPADYSPLMRLRGAMWATTLAEYFRDQGAQVLLLMDSLTRYAQAQREIALAIGEPPATKGYPPSVFTRLPQLVERAGNGCEGTGGITAFYTVLVEGDDHNDPIADAARAILDGHIVLTRRLAEAGHYPAIDIEASISRVMENVATDQQKRMAQHFKRLYAKYQQNKDLLSIGAYSAGSDPELDMAINKIPQFNQFLRQNVNESSKFNASLQQLFQLFE